MLYKIFTQKLPVYTWVKFHDYCWIFVFECHCSIIDIELHMLWPRDSDNIVILTISYSSTVDGRRTESNKTMKRKVKKLLTTICIICAEITPNFIEKTHIKSAFVAYKILKWFATAIYSLNVKTFETYIVVFIHNFLHH